MSVLPTDPSPVGGDSNQGTAVEVVTWIFTSIALVTLILRIYGRLRLTRNPVRPDAMRECEVADPPRVGMIFGSFCQWYAHSMSRLTY